MNLLENLFYKDVKDLIVEYLLSKEHWDHADRILETKEPLLVDWLNNYIHTGDFFVTKETMLNASHYDRTQVLDYLHSKGNSIFYAYQMRTALEFAAKNGCLAFIKWFHEKPDLTDYRWGWGSELMNFAAKNGHLEVVKWLHFNREEGCTKIPMNWAAENNHLKVVQWLHSNRKEGCTNLAMDWAAKNGHLEMVQWLHLNREEGCTNQAMNMAATNGHLHIVKWLDENRREKCTYDAFEGSIRNNHKDVEEYLKKTQKKVVEKHNLLCEINKEEEEERKRSSEFDDRMQLKRRRLY